MWNNIDERAIELAEYITRTGCTVRACAKKFLVSKSTVHKDVSTRLRYIDYPLFVKTRKVLDKNLKERHIRGGFATKMKYMNKNH